MTIKKYRVIRRWPFPEAEWRLIDRCEKENRESERRAEFKRKKEAAQELNAQLTGRWFCQQCKIWHPTPARIPKQSAAISAINQIELRLARLPTQCSEHRYRVLTALADHINEWSIDYEWGSAVRAHFQKHPDLWPHIWQPDDNYWFFADRDDAKPSLTEEQKKLVRDHYPLVLSVAEQYASNSPAWRDDLVTHLLETLIQLWPRYDKTRGVTFGAFAKKYLMGAARDHLKHRPRTISIEPEQIDIALRDKTRKLSRHSRDDAQIKRRSNVDRRLEQITDGESDLWQQDRARQQSSYWDRKKLDKASANFVADGGTIKRRTPTLTDELEAVIAKLNARQQAVFRGMVMKEPPDSRFKLALQLGIRDVTQISRIKRQAERRVAKLLKRKLSPPAGI